VAAKLVVCGAAGRMGRLLITLIRQTDGAALVGAVEASGHPDLGRDAGETAGGSPLGVKIGEDYASVAKPGTVTLDFTIAAAALAHLRTAAANGAAIVIGTTGFSADERREAETLAAKIPTIIAANMSVGVNVLLKLVADSARLLGASFDPEISELHHRMKVDAPSGTAIALARAVAGASGKDPEQAQVSARRGMIGKRRDDEIGVMALRGGDVVGDHTVFFLGQGERLELTHRAQSRECLARGALRAGLWLAVQTKPGLYSMADVLGLTK
jgi:4-hydroxy-tetrahydrodipicolinate reductase